MMNLGISLYLGFLRASERFWSFLGAEPAPGGGVPTPKGTAPADLSKKVDTLLGLLAWAGTAAGVAGVLITGAMMAISHKRGESSEHMSRLGMVLAGCILVATAGPIVSFFFTDGGGEGAGNPQP